MGAAFEFLRSVRLAIVVLAAAEGTALAQQHIGSTVLANNEVTRELSGSNAPLTAGEDVFRNEIVKTGVDLPPSWYFSTPQTSGSVLCRG